MVLSLVTLEPISPVAATNENHHSYAFIWSCLPTNQLVVGWDILEIVRNLSVIMVKIILCADFLSTLWQCLKYNSRGRMSKTGEKMSNSLVKVTKSFTGAPRESAFIGRKQYYL